MSFNFFVMEHIEGIQGVITELTKRQKSLMLKNHNIICHNCLQLNVIHQRHSQQDCQSNPFLFAVSNYLYLEEYNIIKKCYANSTSIYNLDNTISFFN